MASHVVVVGGGISGLAAARAIQASAANVTVTVLEAAVRTGGKLRLGEVAGQPVDLGAEALLNRRPEAVALADDVGLAEEIVYPATTLAGIWTRGQVHPLPRTVMGIPADVEALAQSGIVGRRAVPRARLERLFPRLDASEDVAVGRLVGHRIGGEIRDRLVEPMLGGVYAGRSELLSLHATMPQLVPALRARGRLLEAAAAIAAPPTHNAAPPASVFFGVRHGVGRLASAAERAVRVAGGLVRTGTTVREITQTENGFRLVLGPTIAPEVITSDALILAVPAAPAARLLREVAPRAAVDLGQLSYASMAIVTLAFPCTDFANPVTGSGFLVPPVDGRAIKAVTFSTQKWDWHSPEFVLVRCSIGRYGEERYLQRDDNDLVHAAVMDLREALGTNARLADAVVTRWGGALPQYAVGHLDRVRRVREAVDAVPGLAVCGAAYDGVGVPACIATARQAATRVADHIRRRETMQA